MTDITQGNQETEKHEPLILHEIEYMPGQENKIAIFPNMQGLPIKTAFSWGKESGTMSYKWKDPNEPNEKVKERVTDFLTASGIKYPGVIHMLGVFEGTHLQTEYVSKDSIDEAQEETSVKANFLYTDDPEVAIVIRPADCNISIIFAKRRNGQNIAGFVHSSGLSVNAGIPRHAVRHLIEEEDVDPKSIRIAITPGIGSEDYTMSEGADIIKNNNLDRVILARNWKGNMAPFDPSKGEDQRRNVNILGATIMQFVEEGIDPDQIVAYDINTFTSMQKGEGFSHRLYEVSKEEGKPIMPGRFMVAVKLDTT